MSDQSEDQNGAEAQAPAVEPEAEAQLGQRLTSLRALYIQDDDDDDDEDEPRRKLAPPVFPSAPPLPGSRVTSPSAAVEAGDSSGPEAPDDDHDSTVRPDAQDSYVVTESQDTHSAPEPQRGGHLPHVSARSSRLRRRFTEKTPTDELRAGEPPMQTRVWPMPSGRPELGLGIAFAAGLVIAAIIKRLGTR